MSSIKTKRGRTPAAAVVQSLLMERPVKKSRASTPTPEAITFTFETPWCDACVDATILMRCDGCFVGCQACPIGSSGSKLNSARCVLVEEEEELLKWSLCPIDGNCVEKEKVAFDCDYAGFD